MKKLFTLTIVLFFAYSCIASPCEEESTFQFYDGNWQKFQANLDCLMVDKDVALWSIFIFDPTETLVKQLTLNPFIETKDINYKKAKYYRVENSPPVKDEDLDKFSDYIRAIIEQSLSKKSDQGFIQIIINQTKLDVMSFDIKSKGDISPMTLEKISNLLSVTSPLTIMPDKLLLILEYAIDRNAIMAADSAALS